MGLPLPSPNPPYISFNYTHCMSTQRPTAVLVIKWLGLPNLIQLALATTSSSSLSNPKKLADPEKQSGGPAPLTPPTFMPPGRLIFKHARCSMKPLQAEEAGGKAPRGLGSGRGFPRWP